MKKKYIVISVILIVLLAIILCIKKYSPNIDGWGEFKKGAKDNYAFVQDVSIDSFIPIQINIVYNINRLPDSEEIDEIFNYTIEYLSSGQIMEELISYHKKRFNNSFSKINIVFHLWEEDKKDNIKIFSVQNKGGEPDYRYFNEWYIKYDNEELKRYKTITY